MKRNLVIKIMTFAAVALLFTSCAKAPEQDIANAKAAIEAAKAAEANRYVPAEFVAAQDSLNAALTLVENQKSKFALFRKYGEAKTALANVVILADKSKEDAGIRKEEIKNEVQQSLTETQTMVQETKDLLAKAPRGKEGKEALEAIGNDLSVVEASLNEVSTLINNGDYLTAQDKVNAAKDKCTSLKSELEQAIAKKAGKK
jgi:hypothetical protein